MKLKRKEIDDINEDFSDFSLSSPALKIRRLDVDLPPIMEQVVEVEEDALNPERAIVLFNPPNQINNYNNFTLSVDPHHLIISPYNTTTNRLFTPTHFPNIIWEDDSSDQHHEENKCLAVVPWVAPLHPPTNQPIVHLSQQFMEADECGPAAMDVEDAGYTVVNPYDSNGLPWQQQQQQHCLIPQMPTTTSTPVTWFQ